MVISNASSRGPLLRRYLEKDYSLGGPLEWIINSEDAEVYFAPAIGNRPDPEFLMATPEALLTFAYTGDLARIYKINDHSIDDRLGRAGRIMNSMIDEPGFANIRTNMKSGIAALRNVYHLKNDGRLEQGLQIDNKGRFELFKQNLPVSDIYPVPSLTDEQILQSLVNHAYALSQSVSQYQPNDKAKHFLALTYQDILARFKMLKSLRGTKDIVPDESRLTIVVKAGNGCMMNCNYCPEAGNFVSYKKGEFVNSIVETKNWLLEILGPERIQRMTDGFINLSDIGWLDIDKKGDMSSVEAVQLMKEYFPWLQKLGTFIGSSTALTLSKDPFGNYHHINGKRYSGEYFKRLFEAGINRMYLGVETAYTQGSKILDKHIPYEDKVLAARLIQDAGIKLKVILQVGVLGEGFYDSKGRFVSWEEATDKTIQFVNEVQPYRVLISEFQPISGLPIYDVIRQKKIIPYTRKEQYETEMDRLISGIRGVPRNDYGIERQYEKALPLGAREDHIVIPR